ncbi:MAG: LexA family transcriptional regulator [Brevundimonas sp.]|uniref:LexA family transcriptional regulator n=1 Tax=Brevundimonas sp. TaxID=1871086 RepID=UPI001A22E81A|nr:LexA family transcriptional regulator [Brevundimonas sp.]MBJ7446828.1 LexA family transcriptional regulator [Brevundimonas sp.]
MDADVLAVRALMKDQGKTQADLGRLLGLDSSQVNRIFNGKRRIQRHEMEKIEEWLGQTPKGATNNVVPMPHMVPLYGWVGAASAGRLTLAEQDLRGYVAMHPGQQHVRDAFALEVNDISMSPRYEPGEIVYLAPNRWPARDQDCVVVTIEGEGLLKRYVTRDAEKIVLRQLNPAKDIDVLLSDISSIHSVVGRS